MRTKLLLSLLLTGLLLSCKKKSSADEPLLVGSEETLTDTITPQVSGPEKGLSELKVLTDEFTSAKKEVEKQLHGLSKTEANKLYEAYHEKSFEVIAKIDRKEHLLLENYYSYFYHGDGNTTTPPDSIKQKEVVLKNAGLKFSEDGEGGVYVEPHHLFYYNIFKNYVTDDYKEFLALEAKDNEELWNADAGLGITWAEMGDKVLGWENFVHKFPKSSLTESAKNTYRIYQSYYLFGMDNTRTYEGDKLLDENIAEFKRFSEKYPNSFTSALAKIVLEYKGSMDELHKIIEGEQEKHIGK